ncbi:cyclin, putative [Entamoeba invadens IP1]|uniref:Cyclin, putative n=1 Tax=Entamoeba invadens IP1 TaxID=370355 RepID=A0A0A1TYT8_ENTIV|nr:cyclin, putative [Entamoeba invadens IP1]ELP84740.1 cyclin, putative [Entamoeba invadens IP1]|eukprot:XP_004184086.1 cyclin, putative [Entamoeba invadens IP1]
MCAQEAIASAKPIRPISAFVPSSQKATVLEKKRRITPEFQDICRVLREKQTSLPAPDLSIATPFMRPQMVDWLFRTCDYFKFSAKIEFQALCYVDLYSSRRVVNSDELGLLFLTSLILAARYQDIEIGNEAALKMCDGKYSTESIKAMEYKLTNTGFFHPDHPTVFDFLSLLWQAAGYPPYAQDRRNHPIVEASLIFMSVMAIDPVFTTNASSGIASAAFFFARDICHFVNLWDGRYQKCILMRKEDVKEVALDFIPKMQFCLLSKTVPSFLVCQRFVHLIVAHRQKHEHVSKNIQSKNTKAQCFWDNGDVKNFD